MTHAMKGGWGLGHGSVLGSSNLLSTSRPKPLRHPPTPRPPFHFLLASCLVPRSDAAVINAFGKDDDNNDHN